MPANGQPRRLAVGGRIDRSKPLNFSFDDRAMQGFAGDTLASALLANGVALVGRSFKHGRPRGLIGQGAEEPNAIVTLGEGAASVPNLRATQVELYEGLAAHSGAKRSLKTLAGACAGLMPAGFYYKTFMRPKRLWMFWERLLRRAAGLGAPPAGPDPDLYDKFNQHCDVLVVGGGPTGLVAALQAAGAGARVILADEQPEFGGSLLASTMDLDGGAAARWVAQTVAELRTFPAVQLLPRSTAFGYHDHNFVTILERRTDHLGLVAQPLAQGAASTVPAVPRQRLHRVRAKQTVLATGALERPLVFANNDVPGVMLASALSAYVNRYAVAPGERLLLCTTNDNGYRTALDWRRIGREVTAVVDSRPQPDGELAQQARAAGIEVIAGHGVIAAVGGKRVRGALVAPLRIAAGGPSDKKSDKEAQEPNGAAHWPVAGVELAGPPRRLDCDLIASSGGWSPTIHLSVQAGGKPLWSDAAAAFLPGEPRQQTRSAGAAAGAFGLRECLLQGAQAGAAAARLAGFGDGQVSLALPDCDAPAEAPQQALFLVPHTKPVSQAPPQFVDMQLDVTAADLQLAAREGYQSVEHVKRYTALGFGTDQGKLGNVNGVAILAAALGRSIADTGVTMFRPAYTPVSFGAIAGRDVGGLFDPERRTPMHAWHETRGAVWEDVGRWKRPRHYPQPGEAMQDAVERECLAVRRGVGLMDASTLGKIDIQGPDAALFLNRIYAGRFLQIRLGRCRYGLMLKEDGTIFDDGVTVRLGESRYLLHTTTGNAEAVFAWLERWRQTEWPELKVYLTSVTDHWATAAVAGPQAREVLRQVCADIDLSAQAFPFMSARQGQVAGRPARVFRISFSGELCFEVNVPAQHGQLLWDALLEAGEAFEIRPYGTEAMHVLRAEKGFIIVGQDTDGTQTPDDMGLGWAVRPSSKPLDTSGAPAFGFIGDRSLSLADHQRPDRPQLVGLKTLAAEAVLAEGAQIVNEPGRPPVAMQGHVTSSYRSAALNRSIALAMLRNGRKRMGEIVHCPLADGRTLAAQVVSPVFYDPKGERQHV